MAIWAIIHATVNGLLVVWIAYIFLVPKVFRFGLLRGWRNQDALAFGFLFALLLTHGIAYVCLALLVSTSALLLASAAR